VQVLQFLRRHPAARLPGQVAGADGGQQRLVLAGGLLHRRTTGDQVQEQPVQPVQGLVAGAGQFVAAVTQHPQHHQLRIRGDLSQSLVPQGDHDDRVRAGSVSLAALAGIEHPGPGGGLAGTSSTRSPLASSRCASGRPIPCAPSTAQMRSGHCRATCSSWR
jgi:hypothetical protein